MDQVEFSSLASLLNDQLNPSQLEDQQSAKVASLTQQIKDGTYKPSMQDVAQSVASEISQEILSSSGFGDTDA